MKDLAEIKNGSMRHTAVADILTDDYTKDSRLKESTKGYKSAEVRCSEAADLLLEINKKLKSEAERTTKASKEACASMKSVVNEIKDQLLKVDSILGDNVEYKIKQLERVAKALKTISELSSDNKTMSIVSAMVNK